MRVLLCVPHQNYRENRLLGHSNPPPSLARPPTALAGVLPKTYTYGDWTNASCPYGRRLLRLHTTGRDLSVAELEDLCQGGANANECTRAEFILRMLVWLDRVELDDILKCGEQFDILDKSGDGVLDLEDCRKTSVRAVE